MPNETVARRYSAALFSLAKQAGSVEQTIGELDAFVEALGSDAALREFYESPVIDRGEKIDLIARALADRFGELVLNFIILLVRKRRENLAPVIARQMHALVDDDEGKAVATIATAGPLSEAEVAALARRLSNVYKRTIVPVGRVDAGLLGGAVIQVGDRYVDASVAGKLESIRRHLLETVDAGASASPNGKGI